MGLLVCLGAVLLAPFILLIAGLRLFLNLTHRGHCPPPGYEPEQIARRRKNWERMVERERKNDPEFDAYCRRLERMSPAEYAAEQARQARDFERQERLRQRQEQLDWCRRHGLGLTLAGLFLVALALSTQVSVSGR